MVKIKVNLNYIKVADSYFDFIVEINPKLIIPEQELLVQIINSFIHKGENSISLSLNRLKTLLKIKDTEAIYSLLSSLMKKEITVLSTSNQKDFDRMNFTLISSYEIVKDTTCNVTLSAEFVKSFNKKTVYSKMYLDTIVRFRNKYTATFFHNIILKLREERRFGVEVESLKNILKVEEKYDRIFDFEKKVLKPSLEEINSFTPYTVVYKKIYNGRRLESFIFDLKEVDESKIYDSSKMKEEKEAYNIVFEEYRKFSSLFAIESLIFSRFAKLNFSYNTYTELSDSLAKLEEEKIIVFEYANIRLLVEFNEGQKSLIRIYEKAKGKNK